MGAIDTLSKMINLKGALELQEQRADASRREELGFMLKQQREIEKQRLDEYKYIAGKYTDLYFKAKDNRPLQENILQTMNGLKASMPAPFRQQFEVFTQAGPFSEVAEKTRKFEELYGSGPRNLTEEEAKDPMIKGQHTFAVEDYNQKKEHFLTGKDPGKKRRFVFLGDNNVLARTEDGMFYQTTTEMLNLQAVAKDLNVNPGRLLADDGFVFGTERKGMIGGKNVTIKPYKDVLGNRADGEDISFGKEAVKKTAWETPTLRSFMINFMGESKGSSEGAVLARTIKRLIDDSGIKPIKSMLDEPGMTEKRKEEIIYLNDLITARLNQIPQFKNLNFKVVDPDYDSFQFYNPFDILGTWGISENAGLIVIPGTPESVKAPNGKIKKIYNYQGEAYGSNGEYLGTMDQVRSQGGEL